MIIVLETSGKNESVDNVRIHTFNTEEMANEHCEKVTDKSLDEKYWTFAEIIEDGEQYEMGRYENFPNP